MSRDAVFTSQVKLALQDKQAHFEMILLDAASWNPKEATTRVLLELEAYENVKAANCVWVLGAVRMARMSPAPVTVVVAVSACLSSV